MVKPYQLSDQGNSEGSAALPPHLQCMKRVIPDRQEVFTFWRTGRDQFLKTLLENVHVNSPTDIFGVVFYVVRKISNLIFGDALQPINNQLQRSSHNQSYTHTQHQNELVNLINSGFIFYQQIVRLSPDSGVRRRPAGRAAPPRPSHSHWEPAVTVHRYHLEKNISATYLLKCKHLQAPITFKQSDADFCFYEWGF